MTFSEYIRNRIKITHIKEQPININDIKCQFNPERFQHWIKAVTSGINPLCIEASPHYRLLCDIQKGAVDLRKTSYYHMFELYGRSDYWIMEKTRKFLGNYEDILKHGVKELPEILDKPIMKNPYNVGYEIWEGHHRMAIISHLGLDCKVSLCRWVRV